MKREYKTGILGLLSVVVLILALLVFGFLNPSFSFLHDFISKLGAKGEPNALWFNIIGFIVVGLLLFAFGLSYGSLLRDKLLAFFLALFGLGFAFTAIPIEIESSNTPYSKAHILAICLGLAFWLFGLARMGFNKKLEKKIRNRANATATILMMAMIGATLELWSMPITHRMVFGIVFGWTVLTSIELIFQEGKNYKTFYHQA